MQMNHIEPPLFKKMLNSRLLRWGVGIPLVLILVLFGTSFLFDEPLRSSMEKRMNRDLKGYSVRLPGVHLRLLDLALTLKGLTVTQQVHPETPVVTFPVLKVSIHWREIFSGKLVAEFILERPNININLKQLRSEVASTVSLKERGWQQAVEAIYPLKINSLKVKDASVTYIDQDPKQPLVLSHLNLQASNIRNIHQPDQVYPSSFHLDTAVFTSGRGTVDGDANFLGQPYPGIKAHIKLEKISMDYFKSMVARSNLSIQGGLLQASGDVEYAPSVKTAHLKNLTIQDMKLDYLHSQRTAVVEKKTVAVVKKTAKKLSNNPGILLRADQVVLTGCTLGMVNKAVKKPYRLFLADTDLQLNNFSNQFTQGPAEAKLKARFMGSGTTTATATFRPEKGGPDFDLFLKIEESKLTAINDVLRTYGNFDVSSGIFSLVTELHIKNDKITGYLKPFFKDIKVYDKRRDKDQGVFHQLYEKAIGGVATILENRSRQEVATKVVISGSVSNPETSTWQIVGQLIKNAFFKALLPTFDKEATGAGKR
jgi:hypothetical protein